MDTFQKTVQHICLNYFQNRGWGSELAPERLTDIYNKQIELMDQVSRRSSLSALSLATMALKSYTKEEKELDNNRKSSPTKAYRNAENSARMIRDLIRHHLERTTGGSGKKNKLRQLYENGFIRNESFDIW